MPVYRGSVLGKPATTPKVPFVCKRRTPLFRACLQERRECHCRTQVKNRFTNTVCCVTGLCSGTNNNFTGPGWVRRSRSSAFWWIRQDTLEPDDKIERFLR